MTWGSISLFGGFLEKENPLETLIVSFENVSPKGFSWLKTKYVEISVSIFTGGLVVRTENCWPGTPGSNPARSYKKGRDMHFDNICWEKSLLSQET